MKISLLQVLQVKWDGWMEFNVTFALIRQAKQIRRDYGNEVTHFWHMMKLVSDMEAPGSEPESRGWELGALPLSYSSYIPRSGSSGRDRRKGEFSITFINSTPPNLRASLQPSKWNPTDQTDQVILRCVVT